MHALSCLFNMAFSEGFISFYVGEVNIYGNAQTFWNAVLIGLPNVVFNYGWAFNYYWLSN